jgi:hypothetical protein
MNPGVGGGDPEGFMCFSQMQGHFRWMNVQIFGVLSCNPTWRNTGCPRCAVLLRSMRMSGSQSFSRPVAFHYRLDCVKSR